MADFIYLFILGIYFFFPETFSLIWTSRPLEISLRAKKVIKPHLICFMFSFVWKSFFLFWFLNISTFDTLSTRLTQGILTLL